MRAPVGYMIRRKSDGLYSGGGSGPRFNTVGKVWRNANTFHNHLALFRDSSYYKDGKRIEDYVNGVWHLPIQYQGCEVVKVRFDIIESIDLTQYCRELKPNAKNLPEITD